MFARISGRLLIFLLMLSALGTGQPALAQPIIPGKDAARIVIEKYRGLIPEEMKKQRIPGMAVALVDDQQVIWAEGFGYTDWDRRNPVTADTPFSIQSMSKSFTAAAVMLAVQEGLVDLNTPISQYLPGFHINSIFEERPEDKITLAHLLSHTAGFTHDAPVGNNDDLEPGTWKEHIASISDTWLTFPVGQRYAYSNNGIDLAGYIVEVRSGMPFEQYVKTRLLDPLGMKNSTFDIQAIRTNPNRAIGHSSTKRQIPIIPIMPAGGMYTSANDLARYMLFYLNLGYAGDQPVLGMDLVKTMYTPQFRASANLKYGLGLTVSRDSTGLLLIEHGGGGFGFLSDMEWCPQLKIGVAWLSNSSDHDLQSRLSGQILSDYIQAGKDTMAMRYAQSPNFPVKFFGPQDTPILTDGPLYALILSHSLRTTDESLRRWKGYTGTYGVRDWGRIEQIQQASIQSGEFYFGGEQMSEVQPGLFFSPFGEALDFRGPVPRWKHVRLEKIGQGTIWFYQGFLGGCGLVFLGLLLWPAARPLTRRLRRGQRKEPAPAPQPAAAQQPGGLVRAAGLLTGLAMGLGLVILAVLTQFPYLVLGGLPLPTPNLPTLQQAILLIPYAVLALCAAAAICWVIAWRSGARRWAEAVKIIVLAAFALVLI